MAVAYKAKGGPSTASAGGDLVLTMPTGGSAPVAGDIILIICESNDTASTAGTPATPGGFSKIFEETTGASAVVTLTVFAKRAAGGEGNITITGGAGNHIIGEIFLYSGAVTSGTAWTVGTGNGATSGNGTMLSVNTAANNSLVIMICATGRDALSATQFSNWANANLTSITEREDEVTNVGNGGGIGVADGYLATAGATGNSTVTIATSENWRAVHVSLAPSTGTAVNVTITTTAGLTDSVATSRSLSRTLTATVGFTDALSTARTLVRSLADTVGLSTTVATARTLLRSLANTLGLTTAVSKSRTLVRTLTATVGLTTALSRSRTLYRTLQATLGLSDLVTRSKGFRVVLSDVIGFTDSLLATVAEVITAKARVFLNGSRSLLAGLLGKRGYMVTLDGSRVHAVDLDGSVDE